MFPYTLQNKKDKLVDEDELMFFIRLNSVIETYIQMLDKNFN